MTGLLAMALGGMIPVFLLALLARKITNPEPETTVEALLPVLLAYGVTVLIAAFGMADGGPPKFGEAAFQYGISAVAVAALVFIGFRRKQAETAEEDIRD